MNAAASGPPRGDSTGASRGSPRISTTQPLGPAASTAARARPWISGVTPAMASLARCDRDLMGWYVERNDKTAFMGKCERWNGERERGRMGGEEEGAELERNGLQAESARQPLPRWPKELRHPAAPSDATPLAALEMERGGGD